MAGRGRGRGRGLSINIEALGLGRGELIPSVAQPPPLYPPLLFRPLPPANSSDLDYMVALRQELRFSLHKSPYYVSAPHKAKDIKRYSDKYMLGANDGAQKWEPDWSMFPAELQERKKRKVKSSGTKPNLKLGRKRKTPDDVSDLLEKLEKADETTENADEEQNENEETEEGVKKEKNEDDDDEEEEEYDEEDLEEETDYNLAYFDNGEGYGDDEEDDDEGPTY